jgi:hypothetical protein
MGDKRAMVGAITLALAAPVAPRGCDTVVVREARPPPAECAGEETVYGACVGVPYGSLCDSHPCLGAAVCADVVVVDGDGELAAAAAEATAGTCLALLPGDYSAITLPGGVSVLGTGAAEVRLDGVMFLGGKGSTLRGLTVGEGGVVFDGVTASRVDSVRVEHSIEDGIALGNGASVTIQRSDVRRATRFGISARSGSEVTIETSVVAEAESGAVVVSCDEGCACTAGGAADLDRVLMKDNRARGLWLYGVRATATRLVVDGSLVDEYFEGGSGMIASECADVQLRQAALLGCTGQGILVYHASARIGGDGATDGVEIADASGGVWIQSISTLEEQEVRLERVRILRSLGVGLGVSGHSASVFLRDVQVSETAMRALPEFQPGGVVEVGDGVVWLDRSFVDVDGLTVSSSARASFLIDGEVAAGSRVAGVTLFGGDAAKGIVQQRCPSWGAAPESGPGTPPIEQTEDEVYPVPWE